MTLASTLSLPLPSDRTLAEAYFREAVRHLEDARLLQEAGRYAGSITSTMKSIELGLKSILILKDTRGWHDLNTHRVMTIMKTNSVFNSILQAFNDYNKALISDVEVIELLVPDKQSLSKLSRTEAENTEYPFFARASDTPPVFRLYQPETYFDEPRSKSYYETAHRLLTALQTLDEEVKVWGVLLGPSL